MQLAIIENNQIIQLGYYKDLFPNVSFPSTGADAEFLAENSAMEVSVWKPTNANQKLTSCDPYVEGNYVYTVQVVNKTPEEIDAELQSILTKKNQQTVSMRQARLALSRRGLLDMVDSAITNEEDRIVWEYATEVKRGDKLVQSLAQALGWGEMELDDLFALAMSL